MKYLAAMFMMATLCVGCAKHQEPQKPAPGKSTFEKLLGKWQRTDGDYMLDVTNVTNDGQMTTGYFNPNPIHVEKAVASQTNTTITAFIVLRDVNYPGCTYQLTYDPVTDHLTGEYYQAAMQQTYQIEFTRMN